VNRERYEDYMKRKLKEEEVSSVIKQVGKLSVLDHVKLEEAEQSYGDSWKQRGGVGAFMMLARKWDRLEKQVTEHNYDVFKAIQEDNRQEGIIDDIRDLRRYLFLVEAEMILRGNVRKQK
tara:strand:- start:232 stop:591 length:360 start_codon:yes stop_codon:yes gene_type:complete